MMVMPRAGWEHLRSQINVRRREDRSTPIARCRLCEGGVFIRAQATQNTHVPMFPEVLNGLVRAELDDLGQLPCWVTPSSKVAPDS